VPYWTTRASSRWSGRRDQAARILRERPRPRDQKTAHAALKILGYLLAAEPHINTGHFPRGRENPNAGSLARRTIVARSSQRWFHTQEKTRQMNRDLASPKVNERVTYVSPFRTGEYDAIVRKVWPNGDVVIDVYLPGALTSRHKMDLEPAVHLRCVSYGPEGRARPIG
jgi:hypothetical protein